MTNDPLIDGLILVLGITTLMFALGAAVAVSEFIGHLFPPCERSRADLMHDHIRRMK